VNFYGGNNLPEPHSWEGDPLGYYGFDLEGFRPEHMGNGRYSPFLQHLGELAGGVAA
jgi:hypothetical protein